MRCPYCGSINPDTAGYCVRCGRNILPQTPPAIRQQPQRPPYQQPRPQQVSSPVRPPSHVSPQVQPQPAPTRRHPTVVPPVAAPEPPAPEPPAPFPPRTLAQLHALELGAQPYTLVHESVSDGRKKIVRISYKRCAAWQQVATLLKALRQFETAKFDTIIIQGVLEQNVNAYNFTHGQLTFDRNTRLGSQTLNRYQIETGDGFASDSIRIVLAE